MKNKTYLRNSFFRQPDWRWERVLRVTNRPLTPGRCSRHDDKWIRAGRNFLLRWTDAESDEERERIFWDKPGLFYAYEFHERRHEHPEASMFIQARLLARQSYEQIANVMSTTPEAIEWYEALYFNVVEHLEARDWITKQVLLPAFAKHHADMVPQEDGSVALPFRDSTVAHPFLDASLKLFAYFGGPHLVDLMIHGMQSGKPLTSPEDLPAWLDQHWSNSIRRRSAQAAMQFEINKYNVMELFAVHSNIIQIERSEESQDQQKTTTERHIKAMIDEIPWAIGDQGDKAYSGTVLGRFDNMAAELRDDEVLKIGAGEAVAGIDKNWPDKLPPPRKQNPGLIGQGEEKVL